MTRYVLLSLFAVLAFTTAKMWEPEQHGYTQSERQGMDLLVEKSIKPHWRTHKAEVIAEVWGITPDEFETATQIWRKP